MEMTVWWWKLMKFPSTFSQFTRESVRPKPLPTSTFGHPPLCSPPSPPAAHNLTRASSRRSTRRHDVDDVIDLWFVFVIAIVIAPRHLLIPCLGRCCVGVAAFPSSSLHTRTFESVAVNLICFLESSLCRHSGKKRIQIIPLIFVDKTCVHDTCKQ